MTAKAAALLLGKCVPSIKPGAVKICVTTMELDQNLYMYFRKFSFLYAHDPQGVCKTGDIVLVEALPQKLSKLVAHKVKKVVYPMGDVVDPLTGKRVSRKSFREDIIEDSKLFGQSERAFDYDKAPPRGWQEGKKDFTDKPIYLKYHEDGTPQPYGY